jgi:hypothetical protein
MCKTEDSRINSHKARNEVRGINSENAPRQLRRNKLVARIGSRGTLIHSKPSKIGHKFMFNFFDHKDLGNNLLQ